MSTKSNIKENGMLELKIEKNISLDKQLGEDLKFNKNNAGT